MPGDPWEELKRLVEGSKRQRLNGQYSDDQLDYRKIREDRERRVSEPKQQPTISLETRFEGIYICARPGAGKTQLIQDFMLPDLDMVARGEASMVVQDST